MNCGEMDKKSGSEYFGSIGFFGYPVIGQHSDPGG
jgi:hypothetical protein